MSQDDRIRFQPPARVATAATADRTVNLGNRVHFPSVDSSVPDAGGHRITRLLVDGLAMAQSVRHD